jgi:hypothetical protein
MDREAAVIREEMSQTRVELDRKLALLEEKARELSPRRVARHYKDRYMPEYALDRAIGALLTLVGLKMAVSQVRRRAHGFSRRQRVRAEYAAYGRW